MPVMSKVELRRWTAVVAAACMVGYLAAACTSDKTPPGLGAATAEMVDGSATTLKAAGVTVTLPDGAGRPGTTVTLTVRDAETSPLDAEGIEAIGRSAAVDMDGEMARQATITFDAPPQVIDQSVIPVVVWQDGDDGWRWLPTAYDADTRTVIASVDHFSRGLLGGINVRKWISDRWNSFHSYITGRSGVAQPSCGNEAAARAGGVEVASDRGDRVKWCFGVEEGRRLLKIANNTRTYLQVSYPKGWQLVGGAAISFDADTVARGLGAAVSKPRGTAARILDGGDMLTLVVPKNESGRVTVETSLVAWLVSAIFFGAETYYAVAKAAGSTLGNAARSALDRLAVLLGATANASSELKILRTCLKDVAGMITLKPDVAWDVLKMAWGCVPEFMKSQLKDVQVFAAGVILSMVGAAVGTILTGVHLLATGVRDLWDQVASLGGNSDVIYDVVVRDPAGILAAYVGQYDWGCGDFSIFIDIGKELTGRMGWLTFMEGTMQSSKMEILGIRLVLKDGHPIIVVDHIIQRGYGKTTSIGKEYSVRLIDNGKALKMDGEGAPIPRKQYSMDYPC